MTEAAIERSDVCLNPGTILKVSIAEVIEKEENAYECIVARRSIIGLSFSKIER